MISFIIPSYKRSQVITGVLIALKNQTIIKKNPCEILVSIDNIDPEIKNYTSYLEQIQKIFTDFQLQLKIILVINNTQGLVLAKNKAINLAKYPYIMMMDDDLYMEDDYVESLLKDLKIKEVGAVSGFIVSYRPAISHTQKSDIINNISQIDNLQTLHIKKTIDGWRSVFGKKEQVMNWIKIRDSIPRQKRYNMDYLINSYLFKKEAFIKVKGYNIKLNSKTSAHEEVDFTFRIKRLGYNLIFNPHHMMWHLTVGKGGIYKGLDRKSSKRVLEEEYNEQLPKLIRSISR
ncbi:MAG: glycosyltransferase [Candidatus Daviesbacteria bacterium]|nr:glycosyltransferase [Candidatus Daviesbacteria bacterium]